MNDERRNVREGGKGWKRSQSAPRPVARKSHYVFIGLLDVVSHVVQTSLEDSDAINNHIRVIHVVHSM